MTPTTCPFCNATVPAPVPPPAGGRTPCPRCGQMVPLPDAAAAPVSADATLRAAVADAARPPAGRSGRRGLVVCLVLAGLGVATGLLVNHFRSPPPRPEPPAVQPAKLVPPAGMAGLGYLPDDTDLILGIQVAALVEEAGGEPRKALDKLGLPAGLLDALGKAVGLGWDEIDQLVLGLSFREAVFPPKAVLVVHARQRIVLPNLVAKVQGRRLSKDGKDLVAVKAPPIPGGVHWRQAGERVLIVALEAKDAVAAPDEPRPGYEQLPRGLRELLPTPLVAEVPFFLAAATDRWADVVRQYQLFFDREDLAEPAGKLRTAAVSVATGPEASLSAWLTLGGEEAAREWRATAAERLGPTAQVGGGGPTCFVRVPLTGNAAGLLRKALGGK